MVAMETIHFFIVQLSLSLRTNFFCISGVPMNDLAPMKNCPRGCKVGQISSRGKVDVTFSVNVWSIVISNHLKNCQSYGH